MAWVKLAIAKGEGSMTTNKRADSGFTLIEILVALALTGIVLGAIYAAYQSQHKTYITQESVAEMQQNLRAAMYLMVREIRMAGYDPRGTADAGIDSTSNATCIYFTEDANDPPDGDTNDANENIKYSLSGNDLRRTTGNSLSCNTTAGDSGTIAENISALNFVYLDADGTTVVAPENARSVEITIVAQTSRSDPDYTNTFVYSNLRGDWQFDPADDGFHRRHLSTLVKCRNQGL